MRRIRVFLSSPGDVGDERAIAVDVLDRLRYDTELRERADFEVVAWDRPGASAPILATRTPQASIDEGLPRPADCDIVVVIFWSRMGTALPRPEYVRVDGEPYGSGTEWEFEDAVRGAREHGTPEVLLYRRTPMVPVDPEAPEADEHWRQGRLVRAFFERHRDPRTGALGEAGIMPLLSAARDKNSWVRTDARAALQTVGGQYLGLLGEALRSAEATTRSAAAEALAAVGLPASVELAAG